MPLTPTEEKILASIIVRSDNDPNNPEFPPEDPRFPATSARQIEVPGFSDVWIKDESENPTGTHKDRMAWEIVVTYRDLILSKQRGQIIQLPHMSIISSGSAALAIQSQLREYGLPALRVLVDHGLDVKARQMLELVGCELFETSLASRALSTQDVLKLTNNENGFDITSDEAFGPTTRFYDWLSYEILNENPEYCFVPFGTGNLFESILNVNKYEVSVQRHDPRFSGDIKLLRRCNFLGATTNNPNSIATKLYSPHLPFSHFSEQWMSFYRLGGFCGPESNVYTVQERWLEAALEVAEQQNITAEPSGIAGLALMLQRQKHLPRDKKMLVINTGKTKYPAE